MTFWVDMWNDILMIVSLRLDPGSSLAGCYKYAPSNTCTFRKGPFEIKPSRLLIIVVVNCVSTVLFPRLFYGVTFWFSVTFNYYSTCEAVPDFLFSFDSLFYRKTIST